MPEADSLESKAGCQTVSKAQDMSVQKDGPDIMSDIEGLHPLLGEEKQHVQGGLTRSECELVI